MCYTKIIMRRKKRSFLLLLIAIASGAGLGYLIFSFPPSSQITNYKLPATPLFFALLFLSCASFFGFLLNNIRRGILIGAFINAYLLLRLFGLKQIFFIILLLALFATIELFFKQRE